MYEINQDRQLELLKRLLFAWDAQWFLKSAATFGPDEALKVNARTRAAFGRLEMKAMLALLGKNQADTLADALEIIKSYHALTFSHNPILSGVNLVGGEVPGRGRSKALLGLARCAVLDNAKRAALPINPAENNCIYCQMLWQTWLENLLPDAQIEVLFQDGQIAAAPHGVLTINCFQTTGTAAQPADYYPATATSISTAIPSNLPTNLPTNPATNEPASLNYATPNKAATPLIGGSEVGSNQPAIQPGSLRQRLEQNNPITPSQLDAYATTSDTTRRSEAMPPVEPIVPDVRIDPLTGRPLFAGQMEQDIEAGVRSSKKKNFNLISRVMLSKEAQEMLKKSAQTPTPTLQPMTLASNMDAILQRLLLEENKARPGTINQPVRISNTPYGDLKIQVGSNFYNSIDEVPPGLVKELLQQAVAVWQQSG